MKEWKNPHADLFVLLLWNDDPQSSASETPDDTLGDVPSDTISVAKYLIGCGSQPQVILINVPSDTLSDTKWYHN